MIYYRYEGSHSLSGKAQHVPLGSIILQFERFLIDQSGNIIMTEFRISSFNSYQCFLTSIMHICCVPVTT